jgi:hypothetical protein
LERSGSVVPAPTATVATLTSGLLPTGALRPVATNVALPPARRSTVAAIDPVPDGDVHRDPLLAVHVHVTPVNGSGNESVTVAPTAVLGPLLTTATVHGECSARGGDRALLGVFGQREVGNDGRRQRRGSGVVRRVRIDRGARLARRRVDQGGLVA